MRDDDDDEEGEESGERIKEAREGERIKRDESELARGGGGGVGYHCEE